MSRGTDEEKKFLEDVRRLLAGEEVKAGEDMSEDYRTAINFAQRLAELRAEPSPQFKDQLKQRLLLQLTRQEVEAARKKERSVSFWEFLRSLVPQSPVWRTAAATLVVILVTVGVLWRTGMFTQPPVPVSPEIERAVPVEELPEMAAAPREMEATLQLGVVEKVIELSQTQTVNDISITLERVELSTLGAKFYAFNIPPDYSLPQDPNLPPPSLMTLHAHAEYSVDGGPTKDAGLSEIQFLDDGMQHIWNMLDPVPEDARELAFIITELGEWQGPWQFIIALQD